MPKRIDPDARREEVADAVIEEIAAHGIRSVTLAKIAARSGFAIGSIRHYFGDTLKEVMRFTLGTLLQRAQNRSPQFSSDPVTRIIEVITFTAPTTEQEFKENAALVEYRVAGRTDPQIGAEVEASLVAAREAITSILREVLIDCAIDEKALRREALLLITLTEGFSLSSALLSAPLRESDVRAVVTSSMQRLRQAYPKVDGSAPST